MVTGPFSSSGKYPTRPRALSSSREAREDNKSRGNLVVVGVAKTTIVLGICGFIFQVTEMASFRSHPVMGPQTLSRVKVLPYRPRISLPGRNDNYKRVTGNLLSVWWQLLLFLAWNLSWFQIFFRYGHGHGNKEVLDSNGHRPFGSKWKVPYKTTSSHH